jgi:hypothetical protein
MNDYIFDYDRICLYLEKNGIFNDDSNNQLFMLYSDMENDPKLIQWNVPGIKEPTKQDVAFTKEEMNKFVRKRDKTNKMKKLKNNDLYKIIELLCLRLNIDIDELISQL